MISIKNLNKSFNKETILKDISFNIEKNDVIAILGNSGSGKTTLLRCLNFLIDSDSGEINFLNKKYNLSKVSSKDKLEYRKNTSFVFQNFNLFSNKNVIENVCEPLYIKYKMKKQEAILKAKDVLKQVGMDDHLSKYPSQLSGGQQQRVAIARAIVSNPEVIFFDEPTSALDPKLTQGVLKIIEDLAKKSMTMLIVTHELNFAKNVSNKVIFIQDGQIVEMSDTKQFFENPKTIQAKEFILGGKNEKNI